MNQLHFNLFLRTEGFHFAAWRHESSEPERALDISRKLEFVKIAERGLFDSVFLADGPGLSNNPWQWLVNAFEPLTFLSAIAMETSHIGLIATSSTTYNEPFNLARQFASLDHISHGRAGWNIVTTSSLEAGANFGYEEAMSHSDRYIRAAEFVEVVLKLWDSWSDDAIVANKQTGIYVDPARVQEIDYKGKIFSVRGPLNVARPPQGHPLLVQAGSSEEGMAFGARVADAIFTSQVTLEEGQRFYRKFKELARSFGRDPEAIVILPGLVPVLGSTEAEAKALAEELGDLTVADHPIMRLSDVLQLDLSKYPIDGPVPLEDIPPNEEVEGHRSRHQLLIDLVKREHMTIRDLVRWHATSVGHRPFVGTPEQLADDIERWVDHGAADGFNLMPTLNSNGLPIFVEHVVPLLQKRGLFRTAYEETTLRGHYGLPRVKEPVVP